MIDILEFRVLRCLKCGHEWRSNKLSIRPRCTKCDSKKWIDTRDISNDKKVDKLTTDLYSKMSMIDRHEKYINELVESNNGFFDEIQKLKTEIERLKASSQKRPVDKSKSIPKEDKPTSDDEVNEMLGF